MAVLTSDEKTDIMQFCATAMPVRWTKAQIIAAAQAAEDTLAATAPSIATAMNTATAPLVLTAAEKKLVVARVLERKFHRDIV